MIKIYGIQIDRLPDHHDMPSLLQPSLYKPWHVRHRNIHDERATRASLGGMLLLQHSGVSGKLSYEKSGRPYLEDSNTDFNITHTDKHVFCAIELPDANRPNDTCRVGLDAEELTRLRSLCICPLAERWFTPDEHEIFFRAPNNDLFLQIWTRKEALVKWTGLGLHAMRRLNTVTAPEEYGILFREYRIENSIIVLCHRKESIPPDEITLITEEISGIPR